MFERLSWLGRLALSIELVRGIAGSAAAAAASELMLASLSFSKLVRGAKPPAKPRVWCHGGPCGGTAVSPATPCGDPAVSIMSGVERLRSLSRLARLLELLVPCRLSSVGPKSAARLLVEPPCPSTASARACSRASTSAALGVSSAPVLWLDWLPPLRCRGTPVMLLLKLLLPLPPAASTSAVSTTPPGTMKGRDILPCVLGCGGPRRCATATLRRQAGRLAGWRAGWLAGGRVAHSVRARSHTARASKAARAARPRRGDFLRQGAVLALRRARRPADSERPLRVATPCARGRTRAPPPPRHQPPPATSGTSLRAPPPRRTAATPRRRRGARSDSFIFPRGNWQIGKEISGSNRSNSRRNTSRAQTQAQRRWHVAGPRGAMVLACTHACARGNRASRAATPSVAQVSPQPSLWDTPVQKVTCPPTPSSSPCACLSALFFFNTKSVDPPTEVLPCEVGGVVIVLGSVGITKSPAAASRVQISL